MAKSNGSILIEALGGTLPYTYQWDHGLPSQPNQTNLAAGTYNVTVYDANNCSRTTFITLFNPPMLNDSITIDHLISCNSSCDGIVTVHAFGGTAPYSYLWDDPYSSTSSTINNLCSGVYHVTITDNNGCTKLDSIAVVNPPLLQVSTSVLQNILCYNQCTGIVQTSIIGGTPPYNVIWSNGEQGMVADSLCSGKVFVTVTDAHFCQNS